MKLLKIMQRCNDRGKFFLGFISVSSDRSERTIMPEEMIQLLTRYYSVSEETAAELITELRDLKSLQSLTEPRAARAVQSETHRP